MEFIELFPKDGKVQRNYCDVCETYLDLIFEDFSEDVSGIKVLVTGLPKLLCQKCNATYLPDRSRFSLINLCERAMKDGSKKVICERKKIDKKFNYGVTEFIYDADDYYYVPGLFRTWDEGFLTPIYFNREVLVKYANLPQYSVKFVSAAYGEISIPDGYICFGINRLGHVVMWLGDVAKFPENEQFYLRSENIQSDHCIGSDFYDGQIEAKFTDRTLEDDLMAVRSQFSNLFRVRFEKEAFHLDEEVIRFSEALAAPIFDTEKEREAHFGAVNKIMVESMNTKELGDVVNYLKVNTTGSNSIKRMEAILTYFSEEARSIMMPFYVTYDLRIAYSHLVSDARKQELLASSLSRLSLNNTSSFNDIHHHLIRELIASLTKMASIVTKI